MANQIRVIHPYWDEGSLVFDDPAVGLRKEPFVAGADDVLRLLASRVSGECGEKFTLLFSDGPFPGHQTVIRRLREEYGGNWYEVEGSGLEGWLCPALFRYFETAPERIYLEIKPASPGR